MKPPPAIKPHSRVAERYAYEWPGQSGVRHQSVVPAHLRPFVDALGIERAADFLFAFCGSLVSVSSRPRAWGQVTEFLGNEGAATLAETYARYRKHASKSTFYIDVPCAPQFLARVLRNRGSSTPELARLLKRTVKTIEKYLLSDDAYQARKKRGHHGVEGEVA